MTSAMGDFESSHALKKPRLYKAGYGGKGVAAGLGPVSAPGMFSFMDDGLQSSILECDGSDTDLYDTGDEGRLTHKAAYRTRMQSAENTAEASATTTTLEQHSPGASPSSTSSLVATTSIPGLFLLQGEEKAVLHISEVQSSSATMDSHARMEIERQKPIPTAAEDGEMGENGTESSSYKETDIVMENASTNSGAESATEVQRDSVASEEAKELGSDNEEASVIEATAVTSSNSANGQQMDAGDLRSQEDDREMLDRLETTEFVKPKGKAAYDPEFLAAAGANKGDEGAEWQFDSSDAESEKGENDGDSSDTSDSDVDSDSDAEDAEFPRLSLAEQAKILMRDTDEDGGEKAGAKPEPLRTKHEVLEDSIPVVKPNITLTEADKIEELGEVQSIVDRIVLIKATTSGEYQVLNEGSVVTLANRSIIGTVADLLGRVQDPHYTVRFNTSDEIKDHGIAVGTKTFYSPAHSTFVFTKALKAQKGSDASNLHDEEVDESEIEFSDDEAEAEYRRGKKAAKKNHGDKGDRRGKGGNSRGGYSSRQSGPTTAAGPGTDEPYTPLPRPQNLSELMKGAAHHTPPEEVRDSHTRGGRGGHRGRGSRAGSGRDSSRGGGYGDRRDAVPNEGYDGRHDGGQPWVHSRNRELQDQSGAQEYNPSQAYPNSNGYNELPAKPQSTQASSNHYQPPPHASTYGGYFPGAYSAAPNYLPQSQQPQQSPNLAYNVSSPPQVQTSQTYNHQNQTTPMQPQIYPVSPLTPPIPKLPHGAHVNPAFFARQAQSVQSQGFYTPQIGWGQAAQTPAYQHLLQQQHHHQQQPQQYPNTDTQVGFAWSQPTSPTQPNDPAAIMKAVQDQLDILKGLKK